MSKIKEIIKYTDKTSLFEKQQLLDSLLKDFRLESDIKKFYENEFKKDKESLKEIVSNELVYEYEARILLLEKDLKTKESKEELIHETYKNQMKSAKEVFDEQLSQLYRQMDETNKRWIQSTEDLKSTNKKQLFEKEREIKGYNRAISEKDETIKRLNEKIKVMNVANTTQDLLFMDNYFVLDTTYLVKVKNNVLIMEDLLSTRLKDLVPGKSNIHANTDLHVLLDFIYKYKNYLITENVVIEWFNYFREMELTFYFDTNEFEKISYKPYDILKREITNEKLLLDYLIKE